MINLKVSELMNYIKSLTSKDYVLTRLIVEGEISNLNFHSNGTAYFSIKDEYSRLDCVFHNFSQKKDVRDFKNGDQVGITGRVSLYEANGKLSMLVEDIEKIGLGKIYENFLLLKDELEKDGYFLEKYKKQLPIFPRKIGIITSPTGAAIKDIISVISRKNQYLSIYLYPAVVQGAYAKDSLIDGLDYFETSDMDVIIIGRGGGSYEDLDSFNSKELAIKIFNYPIPVISAVGHEIDFVITDFVADVRAATPSVAAEIIAPDFSAFLNTVESRIDRIKVLTTKNIEKKENDLAIIDKRMNLLSIDNLVNNKLLKYREKIIYLKRDLENKLNLDNEKLNLLHHRIDSSLLLNKTEKVSLEAEKNFNQIIQKIEKKLNIEENRLLKYKSRIDKLDINTMMSQGYTVVTNSYGKLIKSINDVELNESLEVAFFDGELSVKVLKKEGIK
ncbi:MAG: exodeoxyribonuclease VII large subunit [Tissierellia bacterium]|nr:exodeoxyribonuclease VII large subunit [Tissierellia bacterium]